MSPTEFEMGTLVTRLDQCQHKVGNTRMILDGAIEEAHQLKAEVAKIRTILRTVLSVLGLTIAALAWVIELALRIKP